MDFLRMHIEALIFCAERPITVEEIEQCLAEMFDAKIAREDILSVIQILIDYYEQDTFSYQIVEIGGGYQFLTKPAFQASISILLKQQSTKRLSTAALETLSIIAYRQPTTKIEVEQIRGVGCDYAIQKLLERSLIEIKGKSDSPGRPILYGTSDKFMEYFGINTLQDLPTPKDFQKSNEIGEGSLDALLDEKPIVTDPDNDSDKDSNTEE